MKDVRRLLRRLGRAYASSRAKDLARRADLLVILAALALAIVHRALLPLPGLSTLQGRLLLTFAVAGALLLLRPALRLAALPFASPSPVRLAGRLDDHFAWGDDATTAAGLAEVRSPVDAFLVASARGRIEQVDPARLWPAATGRGRLRVALVALFVAVLHLPGVGAGPRSGVGSGSDSPLGMSPEPPGSASLDPMDADAWLREHARLVLDVPDREHAPAVLRWQALTDRPLPAEFAARLELLFDDLPPALVGPFDAGAGEKVLREGRVALDDVPDLRGHLTAGEHRARVRLVPTQGPWRSPLPSNWVKLLLKDGGSSGGGGQLPPKPKPEPRPQPPPPTPPAPRPEGPEEKPPLTPPPRGPEEVVTPLVRQGPRVKKEEAVVAVRDPNAGTEAPKPVPLEKALADFDRVVERAVAEERFAPSDREFLRRYFAALRDAAEGR